MLPIRHSKSKSVAKYENADDDDSIKNSETQYGLNVDVVLPKKIVSGEIKIESNYRSLLNVHDTPEKSEVKEMVFSVVSTLPA